MGDGGVACMSLQHNVMDRFPIPEKKTAICSATNNNNNNNKNTNTNNNNNTNANNNGLGGSKPVKKKKKKVKVKVKTGVKKAAPMAATTATAAGAAEPEKKTGKEAENCGVVGGAEERKDEVEEGELGTLNNAELAAERQKKSEVEKGEILAAAEDRWRKSEPEAGEFFPGKWRRGEDSRRNNDFNFAAPWRGHRDDIEKGEFVPERWHRDDYMYGKMRRYDPGKHRSWKWEREPTPQQPPPPPPLAVTAAAAASDGFRRKEFNRAPNQHGKGSTNPRWESPPERNVRISSKIVDESNNGKSYGKEQSHPYPHQPGNRLKRYGLDSDTNERKHYGEYVDYTGPKTRRLSDDRTVSGEHYSRPSAEKPYRAPVSSRLGPIDKYSNRNYDSTTPSRGSYDRHGRSPAPSERSPRERGRYYDHRDRSPARRERSPYVRDRSPYDRSRQYDHKNRSQSPSQDRARHHDRRDRTPSYSERSPHDRNRPNNNREPVRKGGPSEKRNIHPGNKTPEDNKPAEKEPVAKDSTSQEKSTVLEPSVSVDTGPNCEISKEEEAQSPGTGMSCKEASCVEETPVEELPSMEEDMDICDTPPHNTVVSDLSTGKWFYLDYFGLERGPSKLCDLKALVEDGSLLSDHMVKHVDSDRWMTVENAVSPLVTMNFPSILIPDSVTQLVSPPEAPGNLLSDIGDSGQFGSRAIEEKPVCRPGNDEAVFEPLDDFHIDQRVEALLEGVSIVPGKELEAIGEILKLTFEYGRWEDWGKSEGIALHPGQINEHEEYVTDELLTHSDAMLPDGSESRPSAPSDKEYNFPHCDPSDWFSGKWSCTGGDWKRNDETAQERPTRKKLVLNEGYPLCQMPKSGYEDPRWHHKDDLYYPSQGKRLDLPNWAFSTQDERSDSSGTSRPTQTKLPAVRGVKGTTLPVIRINACVVKDYGSFVSESRMKARPKERHSSKTARSHSTSSDGRRSSVEGDTHSKATNDRSFVGPWKDGASVNTPKDRICTVDDLQLHLGQWYYLDGAGHEQGPSSFSEIQALANLGVIPKQSCVFRKLDRVWVPITAAADNSEQTVRSQRVTTLTTGDLSAALSRSKGPTVNEACTAPNLFNNLHPQFIGYTLGKLHELVMKSYKTREFAAALNDVLDPWLNAKQPKKEIEKHIYWKSEIDARASKRARLLADDSEEDMEDEHMALKVDSTFEELCGEAIFCREENVSVESAIGDWGTLDGKVLARVFHFLRADTKSLVFASATCKHWRAAVRFYRDISRHIDFSSFGPECTDTIFLNTLSGYSKDKIDSMVLSGCTSVTSTMLGDILSLFPSLSTIDIRGCSQFSELIQKYQSVNWIKSRSSRSTISLEESHSKVRSLKHITDKSSSVSKVKGLYDDMDDFGELKEYFISVDKRDSANQFRGNLYKRSKLFDARKSSSILSRDARTRRWAIKKSENGYKRMEEFLASSLKDIMKENTFDFFVPKVAEIQDKMKKGYYIGRGLSSVKEDISRMCRDAIKAKRRGDAGNMNRIVTLFIQLATRLEGGSKPSHEKDVMKLYEDDSSSGFSSTSKYKKKLNKVVTDRKFRSNGSSSLNGSFDYGEDTSDREIRKRLTKLNKRSFDSESDTSDDPDRSFEDSKNSSESTISDTESEKSEGRTWQSKNNGDIIPEDSLDSMVDDREWGARMTKASLVPPVTRKYEVVDQYVVVADEDEVKRKMQVSLPDDYVEKFNAQKSGTEESDMELPEVKEYKPRKQLGSEVLEQEVYGIDPYTHNLLLDSMPGEMDWPLTDKHVFIEDVLLRTLNKKVRHFTGSGNTPMVYPLQPVVEELQDLAAEDGDFRTVRMCQSILRAIDSRTDDKYVAYRKGLGVVCNKDDGFGEDDFVVEFLGEVYPVWKWFEKQDGIRSLQKNSDDPAPEFYNIYLERPKGDADGYDLVVVDAMHKANYASRICHSCRPNCEAKVTAVDGHYQIGIYSVRKIAHGEEITFDYNSVTESKEEYEASVCLCGSQVCRGSYLNLTGEGAFQKVLKDWHGVLDRHQLMIDACETNSVSEDDYLVLGRAGLGSCLLGGLPDWLVAYSAHLVRFINFERTKLPDEILKHNLEEKRKYFSEICLEVEKSDAELQAEGVYNQRLQNLAVTLDKVRYVMRCVFGDPKTAPPPLERLSPEAAVSFLWKGEESLVEELLETLIPHLDEKLLDDLKSKISAHDPSGSEDIQKELKKSLLWLRDELRDLPCTYKSRNDAAADLIHIYAHTKCFFRIREYKAVTSAPVYISPLDLGPKCKDKLGPGLQEYCKTYGENYCLGQLIFWHNQTNADPDCSLARVSRGCLSLPELSSFYAKIHKPSSRQRIYGPKTVRLMLSRMEKLAQKPWPKDGIWAFKSSPKLIGSPMLDSVISNTPLDKEMVHWLKHRQSVYQAAWDR